MLSIYWKKLNFLAMFILLVIFGFILVMPLANENVWGLSQNSNDKALNELQSIGKKVRQAILAKDIEFVLRYDRPDLIDSDRSLLKNTKSDLYCYIFDSSCIHAKGRRSVFEIFNNARHLDVFVRDLGKGKDGFRYGLLYFADSTNVDKEKLFIPEYLCEKGGKEIITWTFRHVKGKWESAHPLFDAETDVYCNP